MLETEVATWSPVYGGAMQLYRRLGSAVLPEQLTAPVGLYGISGLRPRAHIENATDVRRMLLMVQERPVMERFIEVLRTLPQDSCCVDVGAGAGAYTLLAAGLLTDGTTVAVEPDPDSFNALLRNLTLNHMEHRTTALNIALGNNSESLTLNTSGYDGKAPSIHADGFERQMQVRVRSLDYLVENGYIPIPKVIKIDVEGAEELVLEGMRRTLRYSDGPSDLFIEFHPEFLDGGGQWS